MKKILKYFTILFILALLVVIGIAGLLLYSNNQNVITKDEVREFQSTGDILNNPLSGFSQLNEEEKAAYLRIINELDNINSEFYLTGNNVTEEEFNKIFNFILKDHPEYFYVNNYQYYKNNDDIVESVIVNYTSDPETISIQQSEVENWKNAILSQITPDMSNYDIARFLHDYIISTTDYDLNAVNNQNLLSVVENQRSVCAGYSKAYQYLLNQAGIFATYVSGNANVGPHAWNLIQIDGEYGWVDVTWDDPSFIGNEQPDNFLSHQYFGLSSDEIRQTRSFDQTYEVISEVAPPSFNYYLKEGLYFDLNNSNAYNQFRQKLIEAKANNLPTLEIKVADMSQVDQLLTELTYDPILFEGTINYINDGINPSITFIIQ